MISKELLSEISGLIIVDRQYGAVYFDKTDSMIHAYYEKEEYGQVRWFNYCVSIYELQHKCKEWLNKKEYDVMTCQMSNNKAWCQLVEMKTDVFKGISPYFHDESEIKVILKACQWILNNRD